MQQEGPSCFGWAFCVVLLGLSSRLDFLGKMLAILLLERRLVCHREWPESSGG
jgi:hypothetical protein